MTVMNPPHTSSASASASGPSHAPPPTLPTCLVELILALAPIVNPYSPISSPDLLTVLPQAVAPLAFRTLLIAANADTAAALGSNPLRFDRIVTKSTPDEFVESLIKDLFPQWETERLQSAYVELLAAVSKAGKLAVPQTINVADVLKYEADGGYIFKASVQGGCLKTMEWWRVELETRDLLYIEDADAVLAIVMERGQVEVLDYLAEAEILDWSSQAWNQASQLGKVEILEWARQSGLLYLAGVAPKAEVLDLASAAGHVNVLNWWRFNYDIKKLEYSIKAMDQASANNHVHVLNWWLRSGLPLKFSHQAYSVALKAGHADVVQFWFELSEFRQLNQVSQTLATVEKRVGNQCDLSTLVAFGRLDRILASFPTLNLEQLADVFFTAAQFGHVEILEHFRSQMIGVPLKVWTYSHPIEIAAECGQLAAFKWLLSHMHTLQLFYDNHHCAVILRQAGQAAIRNGHIDVLVSLLTNSPTRSLLFEEVGRTLVTEACELGSTPVLSLLAIERYIQTASEMGKTNALVAASRSGHVHVFEWWERTGLSWPTTWWQQFSRCPITPALFGAHIGVLDWFLENAQCRPPWGRIHDTVVAELIANRKEESLKWLWMHGNAVGLSKKSMRKLGDYFVGGLA